MIDALKPALAALPDGLAVIASATRTGAELAATIVQTKTGRASELSAYKLRDHNDPGVEAAANLFEGLN